MQVLLYKRHKASCPHRGDKHYRRCRSRCCSVWMEYNLKGVQTRKSTGTNNWDTALDKARAIEKVHLDAELGRGPAPAEAKTVEQAIALFMDSKRGEDLATNTLYKHTLTLNRLQTFCDTEGGLFRQGHHACSPNVMAGRVSLRVSAGQAQQPGTGEVLLQVLLRRLHRSG